MYIPSDHFLWDFWMLRHRGRYHLFYLQAPRDLTDPEERHGLATVGHAVSPDLREWEYRGTALEPGRAGAWDDRAIWTGSVIAKGHRFIMLYTGTCRAEEGRVQRVGLATSADLTRWRKYPGNPVMEADLRRYEDEVDSPFGERAWRDPYLFRHGGNYYAFITARTRTGPREGRGCVALARARDERSWELLPPAYAPGLFTQMEIPQVVAAGEAYVLLFSVERGWHAHQGEGFEETGTYYAYSCDPLRGYGRPRLLVGHREDRRYGAKLVLGPDRLWYILWWIRLDERGEFVGGLSDPEPVDLQPDGTIILR